MLRSSSVIRFVSRFSLIILTGISATHCGSDKNSDQSQLASWQTPIQYQVSFPDFSDETTVRQNSDSFSGKEFKQMFETSLRDAIAAQGMIPTTAHQSWKFTLEESHLVGCSRWYEPVLYCYSDWSITIRLIVERNGQAVMGPTANLVFDVADSLSRRMTIYSAVNNLVNDVVDARIIATPYF